MLLETLEGRQLMAVGPQLLGIQPTEGVLLTDGQVRQISPRELVFRFDDAAGIDPATLGGIRIIRSGEDGEFDRASLASDLGSNGQSLVEFYAQQPGSVGNGIEIRFTQRSRGDSRLPFVSISGRIVNVEVNSNPALETRVEDLLQVFDPAQQTAATSLVYALRLRGSTLTPIGRSINVSQPIILTGANSARASTSFGLDSSLQVRLTARNSGNAGLGISINVTSRDRGGPGNPIVTVSGKIVTVELNSNSRFPTTVQEFIDAINASDSQSSALVEARLVSGLSATRIGGLPTTYSPLQLTGISDLEVIPAYVGLGDTNRQVIVRFAEALPDDRYRIEILGTGSRALRNVAGQAFNGGVDGSVSFELDLGAKIESIVPQPVERNASGQLVHSRNRIDVYFNDDDLINLASIATVNGQTLAQVRAARTPFFLQNTDSIVFAGGGSSSLSALNPNFYQLLHTANTLDNTDDIRTLPTAVRYFPDADRVVLTFNRNLDQLVNPVGGAVLPPAELRLRIGTNEAKPLPPLAVTPTADPADTFAGAQNLSSSWTPGAAGTQSVLINSEIRNTSPLLLDFPGGSDEPGNRRIRMQDNLRLTADSVDGTSVIFYNFQGQLGVLASTTLLNAITEQQKQRVREVFSLYEQYLGVRFVESENLGLTVAVGDMRAVIPFPQVDNNPLTSIVTFNQEGGTTFESGNLLISGQLATVLDSQDFDSSSVNEYGGPFMRAAMQGIGKLLGLGDADEVAQLTIQSFNAVFAPGVGTEIVLPGDADIVHGQYLYRPDSKDIDLYQFSVPVSGRMTIEAFAERMSQVSLLDSQIRLYQQNAAGGWGEIAANDDYFSSDSFVELELQQGNYIVGVSASGNRNYDPTIADSGLGGRSEGNYQLRMDFRPPAGAVLRDGTGTSVDGDADGLPGGVHDFWFRASGPSNTKFVDKSATGSGNGSLATPYRTIGAAVAAAVPGDVVRVVGNGGADGKLSTPADNLAYEIGFDAIQGQALPDGSTLDVPRDVAVMIDAGAILKLRRARIGVGSTSVNVDRSAGSLMVLGTPHLIDINGVIQVDSAGAAVSGSVYFTSLSDSTLGKNTNPSVSGGTANPGDWGGLDFRNRIDNQTAGRKNLENLGIFLNSVTHADMRYGGGQVNVDGVSVRITPVYMVDARPTVAGSQISRSADAAMSATANSFLETNFHSPAEQLAASFTVDYDRVGPDIHDNRLQNNTINGIKIRSQTLGGTQLEVLTVQGRFDDSDVVHVLDENLEIRGTAGGAVQERPAPSSSLVRVTPQANGSLAAGLYNYRFTQVDALGVEGPASEPTATASVLNPGSAIVLSSLPQNVSRIYRSTNTGQGPYVLVGQLSAPTTTFVDSGPSLGVNLSLAAPSVRSRLDARLAIDPGTIVKLNGVRIEALLGAQLIAEGTSDLPIVFTSLNDNRYGAGGTFDTANRVGSEVAAEGDWGGLYVGHTSSGSLDNAVIAFGGGTTRVDGGFADFNAIEAHQGELRLTRSRIERNDLGNRVVTSVDRGGHQPNANAAIFFRGAQPIIVDNIILDNIGNAISGNVSALNATLVTDYGRSTGAIERASVVTDNHGPLVSRNRLGNNDINGMVVRGGNLTTEGTWDDTDIVHVVLDEIIVPDFQHYGGLRLKSSGSESLVVKLSGATAGFTATGVKLDNANRIGGSVQLMGQPGFPVILTSLRDNSAGAGFTPDGLPQNNSDNILDSGLLPTGPEVDRGTLIDNDVAPGIPGQFAFRSGAGGRSGFATSDGGGGGITAQGNTRLFTNTDAIFEFFNFLDVGPVGNAIELGTSTITLPPTLIASDLVVSEGTVPGANGPINWRVESRLDDGIAKVINTLILNSSTPFGNLQFVNYLDEDVLAPSDDLLYLTGTPGQEDFRAFTLDGPERIGFSHGGVYLPTPGELVNASYTGWAADQYRDLLGAISTTGTTYSVAGNIDTVDLRQFNDPELGPVRGLEDITTAFAWTVNPNATTARITSFLELVARNPASLASSGDWRSTRIETLSNDRNVAIVGEVESSRSTIGANNTTASGQFLGEIAPHLKAGDENRRLGFQVEGSISQPNDVDVYSFRANAGTEVWFDIDRTLNSLDTVVEFVDADGRILALSDNSLAEEANRTLLFVSPQLSASSVNSLRKSTPGLYFQSALGAPKDLYSTNPRDAGLRVVLPGEVGANNLYHLRVRSSNLRSGDPASKLLDPAQVNGGLTKGSYQLQLRLQEVDEIPGSSITYADIRFAATGVELIGVPRHSPLLGETSELNEPFGSPQVNDTANNAQELGNVLTTDRGAISVAGSLNEFSNTDGFADDVDWYEFEIRYQSIAPSGLREYFSTVFDIDYADGIGRPDTSIYVWDTDIAGNPRNLILAGLSSNVVDDQAGPPRGADNSDLSRGSAGNLDPLIGPIELPVGRYFVAVTNSDRTPEVLAAYTNPNSNAAAIRLIPINSTQLIAEDHVGFQGGSTALGPVTPVLFPTPFSFDPGTGTFFDTSNDAIVDFDLNDVPLYISQDVGLEQTELYIANGFTGGVASTVGQFNFDAQDIAFRFNGDLRGFDRSLERRAANNDQDGEIDYLDIEHFSTGGAATQAATIGTTGIQTFHLENVPPAATGSDDGVHPEALTFADIGQERGFFVGTRPIPFNARTPDQNYDTTFGRANVGGSRPGPSYFANIIYEFNPANGAATSAPATNKSDVTQGLGAGTDVRERGYIETRPLIPGQVSTLLVAKEATSRQPSGAPLLNIQDGDTFTLVDSANFPIGFEFNFGPEVQVNYNPSAGLNVTDGMQFTLDGVTFEFDTGSVVVINALVGAQLADGATVRITNAAGSQRIFEFDSNNSVGAGRVAVQFNVGSAQASLVGALIGAINGQSGFGVVASTNAGTNRISLRGVSTTVPVAVTGIGLAVQGTPGVAAGSTAIGVEETSLLRDFVSAISASMPSGITVSYDSGRMNFSGATTGSFLQLQAAGVFLDLGSDGLTAGGLVSIPVLAADSAQVIAARVAQAINAAGIPGLSATLNGREIQLVGGSVSESTDPFTGARIFNDGPLTAAGAAAAPGGIVKGIAMSSGGGFGGFASTLYAVSDQGGLYRVDFPTALRTGNAATYVSTSYDLIGINFTGLTAAPRHLADSGNIDFSNILIGIDGNGVLYAFDTDGRLQPVFANGQSSIATGLVGANGLAFSTLDYNLWHVTAQRGDETGHGSESPFNVVGENLERRILGGSSLYFGFQTPGTNSSSVPGGLGDLSARQDPGNRNDYNFPGGAAGVIESQPIDLSALGAGDLPTLYFNYRFETEQAASILPLANNQQDYMRDALRVYASGEDGQWLLMATNNSISTIGNSFDDEFDPLVTGNSNVQQLFDNNGQWRQARVPLEMFAGQKNVKLRLEFSSAGGFGYGRQGGRGPELRVISGERLVDGQSLTVHGQRFEIEMGPSLTLPGGAAIRNGDQVTIDGITFVFTDGSGAPPASPNVAVSFTPAMTPEQVTAALLTAIQSSGRAGPSVTGLNFSVEPNDTTLRAAQSGITGDSVVVTGNGTIGDNAALPTSGRDVDLVRLELDLGATVTASTLAASIGSPLDTFLRVFDAEGLPLLGPFGLPIQNDNFGGINDSRVSFTAPYTGVYYIGVSGAGNQIYSTLGTGASTNGSTGSYSLSIDVRRKLAAIADGNRLQLDGARVISLPSGSPLTRQGQLGATGAPILVNVGMTTAEVAEAVQQGLANFFASGADNAYRIRNGDTIDLSGLVVYDSFDFNTGLSTPSLAELDPGPFGATTSFIGDVFGAFNTSSNFNGTFNNVAPGALRTLNNTFEGVYLDDFIVGTAGRGELIVMNNRLGPNNPVSGNTNFIDEPHTDVRNPQIRNREILVGPYQLEIRGGEEYGLPLLNDPLTQTLLLTDSFAPGTRLSRGTAIQFRAASQLKAGDKFTISDGTRTLTFELDDVNDQISVSAGNVAIPFNSAAFDVITGGQLSENAEAIAARVRDIINSPAIQAQFRVSANLRNGDRVGATSDTILLIGQATVNIPSSIGTATVTEGKGDSNGDREQGQIVVQSSRISNSSGFGVAILPAPRDPVTNAPNPGSPRNTVTLNTERLMTSAVVMNNQLLFNQGGGISVAGDPATTNVPAAPVPFARLVNNTIVGGTVSAQTQFRSTLHGGQLFDIGNLAFADAATAFSPLAGGGPAPITGLDDPNQAVSIPNYSGTGEPIAGQGVVSLGRGGQLVLQFTDNLLTGSGSAAPDLMVFEVGDSEEVLVEVSADGLRFTAVGRASAASPKIDIDAAGFNASSRLAFVRLTDVSNQGALTGPSVGADIDAVAAISSVAVDNYSAGGQGIRVVNNASATLLNNVIVNSTAGINIDTSSASTVVGGTVFQRNTQNTLGAASLGQFSTVVSDNVPLFVSVGTANLYPAPSSPLIDSSIDSLEDRLSFVAVKQPLGFEASPILAPQYDVNGQLRVDDPAVETPSGLGDNVFKDRGAQDRADFVGPTVLLLQPTDNDINGLDTNPVQSIVELTRTTLRSFDIQLIDGVEPSEPSRGSNIDDNTVRSSSVLVYRDNVPLVEGSDYSFGYDSTNGIIRLTPLAGIWKSDSVYSIRFLNSREAAVVAKLPATYVDGESFDVVDANGSATTFEFDLGYLLQVPSIDGLNALVTEGTTFIVDDGARRLTFEFDSDGAVSVGNLQVGIGATPSPANVAAAIRSALNISGLQLAVTEHANGLLQIEGSNLIKVLPNNSGLAISGKSGVRTVFGLQIPLEAGRPAGVFDGQTFTIDRSGAPVTFELDVNGVVAPGNVAVRFADGASAAQIGAALVSAIAGAGLGLSPEYVGNGLVKLGGDRNTSLGLASTVLTQSGLPGLPAAIRIPISVAATNNAGAIAIQIQQAIRNANLSGVTVTTFGTRVVVEGAQGVVGVGAGQIQAIRDLAGNPLKANQINGQTTVTIFLGEGLDYGDAPAPYVSDQDDDGPRHTVVDGLSLGTTVSPDADAKLPNADDDDGVVFSSSIVAAFQSSAQVTVTKPAGTNAFLSGWIDYNRNGIFESTERVASSLPVTQTITTLSFLVPASASAGATYSRWRLSSNSAGVAAPTGASVDGEVEDYLLNVQANPYKSASRDGLDVNGDGFVSPIDVLQVINYINDPLKPKTLTLPVTQPLPPFIDVNGDGFVSPVDALLIINFLNSLPPSGSGEGEGNDSSDALLSSGLQTDVLGSNWLPGIENLLMRTASAVAATRQVATESPVQTDYFDNLDDESIEVNLVPLTASAIDLAIADFHSLADEAVEEVQTLVPSFPVSERLLASRFRS